MLFFVLLAIFLALGLLYVGRSYLAWVLPGVLLFVGWSITGITWPFLFCLVGVVFLLAATIGGLPPLRRLVVTRYVLPVIRPILPRMGETERIAVEAGTVGWEGEFFTGDPDWRKLLDVAAHELSEKEQRFLDGPVETVCGMLTEWEISRAGDLPREVWEYLRREGFFGMIIPEEYGGLGFSATGHSAVVTKLASRSVSLAVTVMLPNALGPAELILHYGTQAQKDECLARLASGEEIPAFALTEPGAGSDAGSMQSTGVVCEGVYEGEKVLGMRLDWDKRYITLAPVATVLALAFKLRDPDHLLGEKTELGITCALVPTDLPGAESGERHDPLGTAFMNGPTRGKDVFVPLDFIIGGREMAGQGWMMLMQTLAAGRGVSLPSMAVGAAKLATRTAGAYATVRQQFGIPIGRFEGIQEPLAAIGGMTYGMDAACRFTVGAVDEGERPSVASAMVKHYLTEGMRDVVNHAMDISGGAGISLGPRNILGGGYMALPISITVEGANILTRSMIIFGQGAVRSHPYMQDEMKGAHEGDLARFDCAFFGHVGFVFQNLARSFVLGLTNGSLVKAPVRGPVAPLYGRLTRMSAVYSMVADFAMGTLGGTLKRRETITGRLADMNAWMYMASTALKRFHDEGSPERDLPSVTWFTEHALHEAEEACLGVLRNLPGRRIAWGLRAIAFPLGARCRPPADALGRRVAAGLLDGKEPREHLTEGIYVPPPEELGLGQLEATLKLVVRAQSVRKKIVRAAREKRIDRKPKETLFGRAREAGIIDAQEHSLLEAAEEARRETTAVDSFDQPPPPRALSA